MAIYVLLQVFKGIAKHYTIFSIYKVIYIRFLSKKKGILNDKNKNI